MSSPNGFKILCVIIQANYPQCSRAYSHISLFKNVFYRFSNFYFSITSDMQAGSCLVDYKDLYFSESSFKSYRATFQKQCSYSQNYNLPSSWSATFQRQCSCGQIYEHRSNWFCLHQLWPDIWAHAPSCFASTNNVTIKSIFEVNEWDIKNFVSTNNLTEFKHDMSSYVSHEKL